MIGPFDLRHKRKPLFPNDFEFRISNFEFAPTHPYSENLRIIESSKTDYCEIAPNIPISAVSKKSGIRNPKSDIRRFAASPA
jgi:hypothetical protein